MSRLNARIILFCAVFLLSGKPQPGSTNETLLESDSKCYAIAQKIKTEIENKHRGLVEKIEYFDPATRGMTSGVKSPVADRQLKVVFRLASKYSRSINASPSKIGQNEAIIASPKLLSQYIQPLIFNCLSVGGIAFAYHENEVGWSIFGVEREGVYIKPDECISPYGGLPTIKWGEKLCL